jgi:hypothetical protein
MRNFIFNTISVICYSIVRVLDFFVDASCDALDLVSRILKAGIFAFGRLLMRLVDSEKYKEIEEQIQLQKQTSELKLLDAISKIKNHAIEIGDWTEKHSEALENLANALLEECNWKEKDIHDYLRNVVESVPGLSYGVPPESPLDDLLN